MIVTNQPAAAFVMDEFGGGVGFFKGGLFGDAGTGKTTTAVVIANGLKFHFKLKGKIAFFDTETGAEYVNKLSRDGDPKLGVVGTGENIVGKKGRTLALLIQFLDYCVANGIAVAIVDSITHVWDEVQASYLAQINAELERKGKNKLKKLEFHHRDAINQIWSQFKNRYVNSSLHIVLCGRQANVWETDINEETGKREFNVVGARMKVGSDTAYEPSIVCQLERVYDKDHGQYRVATVTKDRFGCMDGNQIANPTFEFFMPFVERLTPTAENKVDVEAQTKMDVNDEGEMEWAREARRRLIAWENFEGLLMKEWPGQAAMEKWARREVMWTLLESRSTDEIQRMEPGRIEGAIMRFPHAVVDVKAQVVAHEAAEAEAEAKAKEDKKGAKKAQEVKA